MTPFDCKAAKVSPFECTCIVFPDMTYAVGVRARNLIRAVFVFFVSSPFTSKRGGHVKKYPVMFYIGGS